MGYQCIEGDDQAPVLLVTNLDVGETMAICSNHLSGFALALLTDTTGQAWEPTGETAPDPADTDEATDEDDSYRWAEAPAFDPAPQVVPHDLEPEQADEDGELGDQLAEDNAVRDQDLREELGAASGG